MELRQLLRRQPDVGALVSALSATLGSPVAVEDADGRLLHGEAGANGLERFAVTLDDRSLGWVSGDERAGLVAAVLSHLAAREQERRALGSEVLHLYREVNLIYSFSEKLAALLDLERVAGLTLHEARQLIVATDGVIMLLDEDDGESLSVLQGFGDELTTLDGFRRGRGILGSVVASGVGEIVNDVDGDPRRLVERTPLKTLLCSPLTVGEKVIGLIALGSTTPMAYTAAELKLLTTLALQTATAIENARLFERTVQAARERERLQALHQAAELARTRLEGEMNLAARIQADLFPAVLPAVEGYECAARNRPARSCGGDYYDALALAAGDGSPRLLACVADVAGKGLPAALVMANMQATLRALLGRVPSLPALADQAGALLLDATPPEKYVTAALVELTPASGALRFVGAGHLDNAIVRADGTIVALASTGPPLGLLAVAPPFESSEHVLAPGDCLVLYSDGVTDAQNEAGDEFGEARLHDVLRAAAGEPAATVIQRVFAAIDAFAGGASQFDDITLLAVRRT